MPVERGGVASDLRRQELHVVPVTPEIEIPEGCRGVASNLGGMSFSL